MIDGAVSSITIKGKLNNILELPVPPTASSGDAYIISSDLYVYTTNDGWVNTGDFRGVIGITGPFRTTRIHWLYRI
jgi:hypothetical protein